jgi:Flp pilus assembly protein protease CpaA
MSLVWLLYGVLFALCGVCVYTDVTAGRVRDRYTVPAIAAAFLLHTAMGGLNVGEHCFLRSLLGLVVAGTAGFFIYNAGFIGGGTFKLLAAAGALLGFPGVVWFFLCGTPPAVALLWSPRLRDRSWHLRSIQEIDLPRERWFMSTAVAVGALCAVLIERGVQP